MAKKYDPQMHTTEHILNQTMVRKFNCGRSFRAHIEKKKSKCDYHFNRNLTPDETGEIEEKVNSVIRKNFNVTEEFIMLEAAKKKYDLSKLPPGAGPKIRIVKVGHYDACPCIGQHVKNTGEIGKFKIQTTKYENGILRIIFKLEPR